jgi:hypothetical protein
MPSQRRTVAEGKWEIRDKRTICRLLQRKKLFSNDLTIVIREVRTMLDFGAKRFGSVLRLRRDEFLEWLEKNWHNIGEAMMHVSAQENTMLIARHTPAGDEEGFGGDPPTLF